MARKGRRGKEGKDSEESSVRPEREFWPEPDCYNLAETGSTKLAGL